MVPHRDLLDLLVVKDIVGVENSKIHFVAIFVISTSISFDVRHYFLVNNIYIIQFPYNWLLNCKCIYSRGAAPSSLAVNVIQ